MIDPPEDLWRNLLPKSWPYVAAVSGALTGVFLKPAVTLGGRLVTFLIGLWAALFIAPLLVSKFLPGLPADSREVSAAYYLAATLGNAILPEAYDRIRRWVATGNLPFLKTGGRPKR